MNIVGWTPRLVTGGLVAALAVVAFAGVGPAIAQQPQSSQSLSASAFLANPQQLLDQNPTAGPQLSNAVQQLVLTDPATFKPLLSLTANATDPQKTAIATGLIEAIKIKVLTDQALAADWQQQVAAITDPTFKVAATNALGDVKLGAIGGAVGAAGNGLGGPGSGPGGLTGGSPPEGIESNPVATSSFTLTSSIGGASGVTTSVSP